MITLRDRYRGCLLGGAVGDALGAGIEFLSLADIRRHGPRGVNGYVPAYGRLGAVTDDTQMTLFTAEGLLRDRQQPAEGRDPAAAIWAAYRRWLATQHGHRAADSWLASQEFLHHRRAPGVTCLSAMESGHPGTLSHPVNNSKGCGGVMRAAPAGLADGDPFSLGCQAAALTHGHPTGHQAAGALALMVSEHSPAVSPKTAASAPGNRSGRFAWRIFLMNTTRKTGFEPVRAAGSLLSGLSVPWWITGGWTIDLAVGHRNRDHADVNVMMLERDEHALRGLTGVSIQLIADGQPPGPWPAGRWLTAGPAPGPKPPVTAAAPRTA